MRIILTLLCAVLFLQVHAQYKPIRQRSTAAGMVVIQKIVRLIQVAAAIAIPIAWWSAAQWLQNFAYCIPVPCWGFLLSGSLAVLVALVTVTLQSMRSARMEQVKSFRSE